MPRLDYPRYIPYLFGNRQPLLLPSGQSITKTDSPKYVIQSDEKGDRYQLLWNEWHALDTLGKSCAKLRRRQTLPCWTSRPGTGPVRGSVVRTIRETGKTDHKKEKVTSKFVKNRKREQTSCQSNFSARAKFITPISVQVLIVFTDLARKMTGKIIINWQKSVVYIWIRCRIWLFHKGKTKSLHVKVPNNLKKSSE